MPDDLEIFVPTRDGLGFVLAIAKEFRRLGLSPRYFIDGGAAPAFQHAALQALSRAEVLSTRARHFADLLPEIIERTQSRWIFRYDDDEAPSEALVRWLLEAIRIADKMAIAVPRRAVRFLDGAPVYARTIPNLHPLDIQFRGFIPALTTLRPEVHMPGFRMRSPDDVIFAPADCCLYHFDWVLRDRAFRARKLARYECIQAGTGEFFKYQYLPEDFDASLYDYAPLTDPAIAALATALRDVTERRGG